MLSSRFTRRSLLTGAAHLVVALSAVLLAHASLALALTVAVAGVVAVVAVPAFFARGTGAARLADALEAAASGDLSGSLPVRSKGDLGRVEAASADLYDQLRTIVSTVAQAVDDLHVGRMSVADMNKEMLDAAELTAGQAYDAGQSAAVVSNGITVVAAATVVSVYAVATMRISALGRLLRLGSAFGEPGWASGTG